MLRQLCLCLCLSLSWAGRPLLVSRGSSSPFSLFLPAANSTAASGTLEQQGVYIPLVPKVKEQSFVGQSCSKSAPCKGDLFCSDSKCERMSSVSVGASCVGLTGCPTGFFCGTDGVCTPITGCITSSQCAEGFFCFELSCKALPPSSSSTSSGGVLCITHSDCPSGTYCSDNECHLISTTTDVSTLPEPHWYGSAVNCLTHDACPKGFFCYENKCTPMQDNLDWHSMSDSEYQAMQASFGTALQNCLLSSNCPSGFYCNSAEHKCLVIGAKTK